MLRSQERGESHFFQGDFVLEGQGGLKDISVGGACIKVTHPLPVGKIISLEIKLPEESFSAQSEVRWCSKEGTDYLVGLQFMDLEEKEKEIIQVLVSVLKKLTSAKNPEVN